MNYYTVYRDDEIVAFRNANQCTEKLQLKKYKAVLCIDIESTIRIEAAL